MKKSLSWALVLVMSISLVVFFNLSGCRRVEEHVVEEANGELEEEVPQQVTGSDDRLRIVVDNIERYNRVYTERIVGSYGVRPLRSGEGVDQIVIYLTITPIQDICVAGFDMYWFLADTDGNECTMHKVEFYDLGTAKLGSSCREEDFWEETEAEVIFPFPEYATLAKLKVVYSFLEPGEGESTQQGQIDIILP